MRKTSYKPGVSIAGSRFAGENSSPGRMQTTYRNPPDSQHKSHLWMLIPTLRWQGRGTKKSTLKDSTLAPAPYLVSRSTFGGNFFLFVHSFTVPLCSDGFWSET